MNPWSVLCCTYGQFGSFAQGKMVGLLAKKPKGLSGLKQEAIREQKFRYSTSRHDTGRKATPLVLLPSDDFKMKRR